MTASPHPRSLESLDLPFATREGELLVNGIPVTRLAARVGRTPFFAYDRSALVRRVEWLRTVLPPSVGVSYAVKANPMPALVQLMAGLVDGLDVASAGELATALDTGMEPARVSFAGPGKRIEELHQAVAAGILVNVESERELPHLVRASESVGLPARVAIRVNPPYGLRGSGLRMGGGSRPFGIDAEQVPAALRRIRELGLSFEGFHIFAGSQNLDGTAIADSQREGFSLALDLATHAPAPVRILNLGGGFGIPYFPGDTPLDLEPVSEALAGIAGEGARELPDASLHIELGRYLVGPAGIYVCRILDRKDSRGTVHLVADGGLHHHLAASGNFGQVLRKNYPVAIANRMGEGVAEPVNVVGPLCTPLDLLADRLPLPKAGAGDLVVIFQSGAYGASASPERFLGHPPALEVLV